MDHPLWNATLMVLSAAVYAAVLWLASLVALSPARRELWLPLTAGASVLAVLAWPGVMRPLPLLVLALVAIWRRTLTPTRVTMAVFSLALLGKMILNVRIWHYGFALAMPGTMLLVVLLTCALPERVERQGGSRALLRQTAVAFLVSVMAVAVIVSFRNWRSCSIPVGSGSDRIMADARGRAVESAIEYIGSAVPLGKTLVVMPEGVMINYLAHRTNPTPYINFMPPELSIFGEERILDAMGAHPPDYVAVVDKDTSEYGVPRFGRDYGKPLMDWVQVRYSEVVCFGARPLTGKGFGVLILKRK